ncbi:MAG: Hsp20/alpha crystallin family protein [Burkholderiales bacterium]|nr:Hsp20/alpha crystallin family protein [Pseudomonadota bacterium]
MANVMRWEAMDDQLENLVQSFFRPASVTTRDLVAPIRMDVSEKENAYVVHAEMPGVKKEDIKIEIDGNEVSISAESKNEKEVKVGDRALRSERYYGKVSRSFSLAQEVDDDAASAKFENGVLELALPKKAVAKAKLVSVA